MGMSEARRQINLAYSALDNEVGWSNEYVMYRVLAHGFNAVVEAIAENKPYDGTLNNIRVPVVFLRQILVDMNKAGVDEIGMEDFLVSIRARLRKSPDLDNDA